MLNLEQVHVVLNKLAEEKIEATINIRPDFIQVELGSLGAGGKWYVVKKAINYEEVEYARFSSIERRIAEARTELLAAAHHGPPHYTYPVSGVTETYTNAITYRGGGE